MRRNRIRTRWILAEVAQLVSSFADLESSLVGQLSNSSILLPPRRRTRCSWLGDNESGGGWAPPLTVLTSVQDQTNALANTSDNGHHFDENVHRWAGCVLERVTNGVSDDGSLVGL